jgi:hypothetical protein
MGQGVTFATVRAIGLAMPGVEEGTLYGSPALKVEGQMFVGVPSHKSAEPNSLLVRMAFERRDDLLAEEPATYYVKEHYLDYPCVLVRLDRVTDAIVRDLLLMGYRFVSAKTNRKTSRPGTRMKASSLIGKATPPSIKQAGPGRKGTKRLR